VSFLDKVYPIVISPESKDKTTSRIKKLIVDYIQSQYATKSAHLDEQILF